MFTAKMQKAIELMHYREVWQILSALRGPDLAVFVGDTMKTKYTGVIRHWAISDAVNCGVRSYIKLTPDHLDSLIENVANDSEKCEDDNIAHYLSHVDEALRAIRRLEEIIPS